MHGRVSVVIMLVAVAGCDGDSTGGSCSGPDPCGGDVVGTWKVVDSCLDFDVPPPDIDFCPTATADLSKVTLSGGITFDADLTYSSTLTLGATLTLKLPSTCLTMNGVTVTCAQFNDAIQAQLATDPNPAFQSYTCASGGSACNCTVVAVPETKVESGTYSRRRPDHEHAH